MKIRKIKGRRRGEGENLKKKRGKEETG